MTDMVPDMLVTGGNFGPDWTLAHSCLLNHFTAIEVSLPSTRLSDRRILRAIVTRASFRAQPPRQQLRVPVLNGSHREASCRALKTYFSVRL